MTLVKLLAASAKVDVAALGKTYKQNKKTANKSV
jgi:hypothetical protein